MADHQTIIDQIKAFLASSDQTRTSELRGLASAYAALCKETNDRLRRCADYLRRGLRSEAIHLAAEEPDLLDLVAVLDLPEIGDWENICIMYELAKPPRLLADAARELGDAQAAEQPLHALLDRHRRLALLKAPLAERIAVMRQIADMEPQSRFWDDDIRSLETVRLKEIVAESAIAAQARDRVAVARLLDEVTAAGWRCPVLPELIRGLKLVAEDCSREDVAVEIQNILPELDAAHAAMDVVAAGRLLARIHELVSGVGLQLNAAIADRIGPVEQWIEQDNRRVETEKLFAAACARLENAIELGAETQDLERLKREALSLGLDLPPEISARFRKIVASRQQAGARRHRTILICATTVMLVIGLIAGLVIRASLRDRRAKAAFAQFEDLVLNERLEEAVAFHQRLARESPEVTDRAEIRNLRNILDDKYKNEKGRIDEFRGHMNLTALKGPEAPNLQELDLASQLARSAVEKREILDFRARVESARQAQRVKLEDNYRKDIGKLAAEVQRLEDDARGGVDIEITLNLAEATHAQLLTTPNISDDLKKSLEPLAQRLKTLHDSLQKSDRERAELAKLIRGFRSTGSAGGLKVALDQFVAACPDSPRAVPFRQASANLPAAQAVEEWSKIVLSWQGRFLFTIDAAAARVKIIDEYAAKHPASPFLPAIREYKEYLSAGQKSVAPDGPWRGDFKNLLSGALIKDLKCVRSTSGKTYYLPADAVLREQSVGVTFEAITTSDAGKTQKVTLKAQDVQGQLVAAPQSVLARDLLATIEKCPEGAWDTLGLEIISTIHARADVDPLLRAILLGQAIRLFQTLPWQFPDSLKTFADSLGSLNADDLAWMNPDDAAAEEARRKAPDILSKLSDIKSLRNGIDVKREAMFASLYFRTTGAGLFLRNPDGPRIETSSSLADPAELFVLQPEGATQAGFVKIGQVKDGKIILIERPLDLPDGSLVFLGPPSKK